MPRVTPALPRNKPDILFDFKSVVIVGASDETTRIGGVPILLLKKYGYPGKIYGLNPKYETVQGFPCFAEPEQLPGPVDLAMFCVSAERVREMLPRLQRKGLKGAVIFSAGFGETPEGKPLQDWLTDYVRRHRIAVVGPNCVGQISFAEKRSLTFANPMLVFPVQKPGRVALLSQSGGVAGNIWADVALTGTRFSHVITTGNEADLDFADFLGYLADDRRTGVVLGYIEGLRDGAAFCAAAARMRARRKPLILIKVGTSAMGQDAVASHTGQLSSDDAGYQAAFDRHGVIRVHSLQDLTDYARLFALDGLKPKVTVATTSGGTAVYVADLCAELGVELATLSAATRRKLSRIVPSFGRVRNPVDLTAQVVNDVSILEQSLHMLLDDPQTGILLFLLSGKGTREQSEQAIALFKRVSDATSKTLVLCWLGVPEEVRSRAAERGLLIYQDPARFLRPLADYFRVTAPLPKPARAARRAPAAAPPAGLAPARVRKLLVAGKDGTLILPEDAATALLETNGVDCPRRWFADSAAAVARLAERVSYPCVMKIVAPVIAHKSDVGGVVLGIADGAALQAAWAGMAKRLKARRVVIVEQIPPGVEVLVGWLRDATFGSRLTIGTGGVWTNFARDTVTLIPPYDAESIRAALPRLSIWPALSGARGQPTLAVEPLIGSIAGIARVGEALAPVLRELECNPVIVGRRRAVAVDAIGFA